MDPNKPLQNDSRVVIRAPNVASLQKFTICARFMTYQFDSYFEQTQNILSFGSYTVLGVDSCKNKDCYEIMKERHDYKISKNKLLILNYRISMDRHTN